MTYSVTQASRLSGVSKSGIRLYCRDWEDYLSESANPPRGTARRFTQEDIAVFRTIKTLRDEGYTTDQIQEELEAGERYEPNYEEITTEEPHEATQARNEPLDAAHMALELIKGQVDALTNERDYLREQLENERVGRLENERKLSSVETELRLLKEQMEKQNAVQPYEPPTKKGWLARLLGL